MLSRLFAKRSSKPVFGPGSTDAAHAAHGPLIELCDPYVLEIATVDFEVTGGTPPGHIVNRRGR